ncbi:MAG TPA: hypothetical protein VNB28_01405 [Methylomirabilota bacterium]|jgi:hypothetical protein|nr:hypothetical protein [Methylomirabilota bacterium]
MFDGASISLDPIVPILLLIALAAAAALLVAFGLFRRARGSVLRALAFAALLAALANPSWVQERREPLSDVAVIVADESASQRIEGRADETAVAVAELEQQLRRLPGTEVRVVRIADAVGTDAAAEDEGTRLFSALERALTDVPRRRIAGVIAVTDGQVHDAPESAEALELTAPFHVLLTGREGEIDRRLIVKEIPTYGIVGQKQSMVLRVDDMPGVADGPAAVTIRRDGRPLGTADLAIGEDAVIEFMLEHAGPTVFEIEASARDGELTLANNRAVVVVNGVRDRLRVLLVSGEPHAGERTWRNLLKADPAVDLVHFTILRPPEKQDGTPIRELSLIAFPIRELFEVKLDEFDLIIFDRYRQRGVLPRYYYENIAAYVDKGGALLESTGPSYASSFSLYRTPLGEALPAEPLGRVIEGGFKPRVTDLGRRHPVTADLPGSGGDEPQWGRWFRLVDVGVTRGFTVMSGTEGRPLLVLDRYGEGRVAQIMSDHVWLWSRGFEGGGPQAELLRRLAHWLMKEPDLEEEDLRAAVHAGKLEITRRSLSEEAPEVKVTAPSGATRTLRLEAAGGGRWSATLPAEEVGLYRVDDDPLTAFAASGALNPIELADVRSTPEILAPIAAETGGTVRRLEGAGVPELRKVRPGREASGNGWIGIAANRDYLVTGIDQVALLPGFVALALLLGTALLAWHREGR